VSKTHLNPRTMSFFVSNASFFKRPPAAPTSRLENFDMISSIVYHYEETVGVLSAKRPEMKQI